MASGLIVHIRDTVNLLGFNEFRDFLDHLALVDHIRNLGDNDGLAAALAHFDFSL